MTDAERMNDLSNRLREVYFAWAKKMEREEQVDPETLHTYAVICVARLYALSLALHPKIIEKVIEPSLKNFPALVLEQLKEIAESAVARAKQQTNPTIPWPKQ